MLMETETTLDNRPAGEPERWRWQEYERRKAAILATNPPAHELETRLREEAEELEL